MVVPYRRGHQASCGFQGDHRDFGEMLDFFAFGDSDARIRRKLWCVSEYNGMKKKEPRHAA